MAASRGGAAVGHEVWTSRVAEVGMDDDVIHALARAKQPPHAPLSGALKPFNMQRRSRNERRSIIKHDKPKQVQHAKGKARNRDGQRRKEHQVAKIEPGALGGGRGGGRGGGGGRGNGRGNPPTVTATP
jgi:hypothetical protein